MPINSQKLLTIVSRLKQLQNNDMVRELVSSAWDGINPKTKLTDSEEKDFMDWYLRWAMLHKQSLNPDERGHHYDYRGYWKEARPNFVGALNSHLPDTYKTPGHPTFSVESKYYSLAPGLAGSWNGDEFVPPQKVDLDRIRLRQRYAESTFNDRAVSKAGAKGAFQIMPKTYEQYAKKIGEGDLFDPEYNGRMRDAIWEDYYNSKTASNGTPTDQVRVAKALAMYNAGWGRVGDWLDKQKKAGVDIYGSLDWVDKMPWKETRDYVNFILNEKDTGSGRTNAEFDAAVKKYGYADGGKIHIDPSKKGTFTAAASKHGKSVQAFASHVLANKKNYSPAMVKKANFARNAAKWHADGGLLHTFDDGGDVEYYDTINPAIVSASLPDPRSGKGNQIAYNMAQRIRNGELLLKDVPRSYQNYVEGIVAPGGSLDVSKAIVENGVPIAAPIVGAAAAGPLLSTASEVVPHALSVMANPATANTSIGSAAATLLDASGLVSSAYGLADSANKALDGEYSVNDIPETIFSAFGAVPGASAATRLSSYTNAVNAAKDIAFIPKISSGYTATNRFFHPVESYRFANIARKAQNVMPEAVYNQSLSDLQRTKLYNRPPKRNGYWVLNRKPAEQELAVLHGWDQNNKKWIDPVIMGLGDQTATNQFSRGHEFGHIVWDAADKAGYKIENFPPALYQYNPGESILNTKEPGKIIQEYFADVLGNSVSSDMVLDKSKHVVRRRYPYVKNVEPEFSVKGAPFFKSIIWKK